MAIWFVQRILTMQNQLRNFVHRVGEVPLLIFAVAGAMLLYSFLKRKLTTSAASPQRSRAARTTTSVQAEPGSTHRLDGVRRVTLGLDANIPTILTVGADSIVIDTLNASSLTKLVSRHDVYVIVRVDSDRTEDLVSEAFKRSGLYEHGLNPLKIVYCETEVGRVSAVRQLEPHLHVDCDAEVVRKLQRFVHQLAYLNPNGARAGNFNANVLECTSIAKLFDE
mmetsp:Transcript_1209/g.3736  ORF Transcript_1209/g.3736 Transcript_1209/m.3736 type:complete len:223 (+) Transcript_1209:287-955(+)